MLWEYYRRAKTVDLISEYAQIYKHYGRINLEGNAFPLPIRSDHSYRSTFGAGRSFGAEGFMKEPIFCRIWRASKVDLLWHY